MKFTASTKTVTFTVEGVEDLNTLREAPGTVDGKLVNGKLDVTAKVAVSELKGVTVTIDSSRISVGFDWAGARRSFDVELEEAGKLILALDKSNL